jgi:hypothetical protein
MKTMALGYKQTFILLNDHEEGLQFGMWEPLIYFLYQNKNGSPNLYHGHGRKTKALGPTQISQD